ncbi:unnamed protein product [Pleuronectes platessa]|uniref:Uncharacterized protein n=1 Tax=Pleuronectes platessa TaxID=8262 RepID=A0A9N7Y4H5_PLEPL|nr:unnamed protein product [Pleuronectes platessa]
MELAFEASLHRSFSFSLPVSSPVTHPYNADEVFKTISVKTRQITISITATVTTDLTSCAFGSKTKFLCSSPLPLSPCSPLLLLQKKMKRNRYRCVNARTSSHRPGGSAHFGRGMQPLISSHMDSGARSAPRLHYSC